ncbi:hypothetical protein VUR80DRAFT_7849 [Thermomyces stellatus]
MPGSCSCLPKGVSFSSEYELCCMVRGEIGVAEMGPVVIALRMRIVLMRRNPRAVLRNYGFTVLKVTNYTLFVSLLYTKGP